MASSRDLPTFDHFLIDAAEQLTQLEFHFRLRNTLGSREPMAKVDGVWCGWRSAVQLSSRMAAAEKGWTACGNGKGSRKEDMKDSRTSVRETAECALAKILRFVVMTKPSLFMKPPPTTNLITRRNPRPPQLHAVVPILL